MLIYLIAAFIIWFYGMFGGVNSSEKRKKRYVFVCFALMILIAGLRSRSVGIDLQSHFAISYEEIAIINWNQLDDYAQFRQYGVGFCYFCKLLTIICSDAQFFIFVTSMIVYGSVGYFVYKHSKDVALSTCLFMFFCLFFMFMNVVRQALALAIVLIGFEILQKKSLKLRRYLIFGALVVLASTFHTSAILCLPFVVLFKVKFKKIAIIFTIAVSAALFFFYDDVYELLVLFMGDEKYSMYVGSTTEGGGSLNRQSIIMFILTLGAFVLGYMTLVLSKKKYVSKEEKFEVESFDSFLLWIGFLATVCRLLIFRMNIINRLSYYFVPFVIILYPEAINALKNSDNRKIIRTGVYVVFWLYFLWMTTMYAGSFYGVVPYKFFWQ